MPRLMGSGAETPPPDEGATVARKLYFPLADVVRVAEATVAAPTHHVADWLNEGIAQEPALMWVKDDGTYLMSNAEPRPDDDVIYARTTPGPRGQVLNGGGSYDLVRSICGGDDFAEYLTLNGSLGRALRDALDAGAKWLVIGVSAGSFSIETTAG